MLEEMNALDLMLWMHYQQLHPIGEEREDLRMAIQTAALVNIHLGKGRKVEPKDYLLKDGLSNAPERKQTWQEQMMIVEAMAQLPAEFYARAAPEGEAS